MNHNPATIRWLANMLHNEFRDDPKASLGEIMSKLDQVATSIEKRRRTLRMLNQDGEPSDEALRIAEQASARLEFGED